MLGRPRHCVHAHTHTHSHSHAHTSTLTPSSALLVMGPESGGLKWSVWALVTEAFVLLLDQQHQFCQGQRSLLMGVYSMFMCVSLKTVRFSQA